MAKAGAEKQAADKTVVQVTKELAGVRTEMDKYVIGHDDVKEAILLGVVSREHIYLEGPPGTAKTMLAEITSRSANLHFYFYQLHRDTRLAELVGDIVISREQHEEGELIRQRIRKGGLLTAEICILDDISRAPGEALNVLLRVLNERKFGQDSIPLLTAIATSNPVKDDYYNEPLDPANLDRFTIQMRTPGLIQRNRWKDVTELMSLYAADEFSVDNIVPTVDRALFDRAFELMHHVTVPNILREALIELLSVLINDYKLDESNSLITDRTFSVKALKIIRAKATMEGRQEAVLDDLHVLKYITTFRIPPEIHEQLDKIIDEIIQKKKDSLSLSEEGSSDKADDIAVSEMEADEGSDRVASDEDDANKENVKVFVTGSSDREEEQHSQHTDDSRDEMPGLRVDEKEEQADPYLHRETVENIELLLKILRGRVERNVADRIDHHGGVPRTYKRMTSLEEMLDSDVVESSVWARDLTPELPRAYRRERDDRGGQLAIVRDISASMRGRYTRWASCVSARLIEMARKKKMKVGYIEFNHLSSKFLKEGNFFIRKYDVLLEKASKLRCFGTTNYEESLSDALSEFGPRRSGHKHIIFLTDGVPTAGNRAVKAERDLARKLGVLIHAVYIGPAFTGRFECPNILERISGETGGSLFQAKADLDGVIRITERLVSGVRSGGH